MRFRFYLLFIIIYLRPIDSHAWRKIYRSQDTLSTETSGPIIELPGGGFLQAINTNCYGNANTNILIIRLNPEGIRSWTKLFGGTGDDVVNDMKITPLGEVIVAGSTNSYGIEKHDFYIIKIDQSGNLIWSRTFGNTNDDILSSIELNTNGDVTLLGTSTNQSGNQNLLAIRIDNAGNQLWNHIYQTNATEVCNGSTILHNGSVILVGYELNGATKNSLAQAIDGNGSMIWKQVFPNVEVNYFLDACEMGDSSTIVLVGGILNSSNFMTYEGYSVKVDFSGNTIWTKPYFPFGSITKIELTEDRNINLYGYYADFNYALSITKCDTALNTIWRNQFNTVELTARNEITCLRSCLRTKNNKLIFAGETNFEGSLFPYITETDSLGSPIENTTYIDSTNNTTLCEGDSSILTAPSGFDNYFWFDVQNHYLTLIKSGDDTSIIIKNKSTIKLIAIKKNEIYISNTIDVTVGALPSVSTNTTLLQFCKNDQSPALSASINNCTTVQWYKNNSVIPGQTTQFLFPDSSGQYYVVGQNQCGIDTSLIVDVQSNYYLNPAVISPEISIQTYPLGQYCMNDPFHLPTIAYTSYQWYQDSTPLLGQTSNFLTNLDNNLSTTANFYCIVSNGCGIDTTNIGTLNIVFIDPNNFRFSTTSPVTGCYASNYLVYPTDFLLYTQWYDQSYQVVSQTPYFYPSVTGYYYYSGYSGCDLTSVLQSPLFYFEVNPSPIPVATPNGTILLCSGDSTVLTTSCQLSGATFQWQKNGIDILSATDSIYTALDSGAYSCIAITSCGANSSNIVHISNYSLQGILTCPTTTICSNDSIKLDIQSGSNVLSYKWRKNGQLLNAPSRSYLYINQPGSYDCLLLGHCNDSVLTNHITIHAASLPTASNLNNTTLEKCLGDSIKLEVSSQIGNTYEWHMVGNIDIYSIDSTLFTFQNGIYFVKISNSKCHIFADTTTVVFTKNFNNILSNFDEGICNGTSIELRANLGYNPSFQWLKDNLPLQNATDSILITTNSGNYQVIINNSFCYDTSNVFVVMDSLLTLISIIPSFSQINCNGSSVTLSALFSSGQFQWAYNGSQIPGANSYSLTTNDAGTYTLMTTNTIGCTGIASIEVVTINSMSQSMIYTIGNSPFCIGDSLMVFVQPITNSTYEWYFNNSIISNANNYYYYVSNPGCYKCLVNDNCSSHFNDSINITTKPFPINSTNSFTHLSHICINQPAVIFADPVTDADYYSWNLPNNIHPLSGLNQQQIIVQADNQFAAEIISVSGVNECGNSTPISALFVREFNCLLINDPTQNNRLRNLEAIDIFPNPSQNNFTIRLNDEEVENIQVINSIGAVIKTYVHPATDIIFGDNLPSGIYFVRIIGENENAMQRVVKM